MHIVAYMAYASLIILAVVWTIDVRIHPYVETPGILRAVYFISVAVLVPAFDVNMAHALWLAPFGCFFARLIAPRLITIPVLSVPFVVVATVFARMVRIGMPVQKRVAGGGDEPLVK